MVNWLIVGVALIVFAIFPGSILDLILIQNHVDFIVFLALGGVEILLPLACFFIEMNQRSQYPIRVDVEYQIGDEAGKNVKTIVVPDRIGLKYLKNEKDEKMGGAQEWRMLRINRPVQGFSLAQVVEKKIWFGFKKAQTANVYAVNGEKGEEFYGVKRVYNKTEDGGVFKPVFESDRALQHFKMQQEIDKRNTKENFWKEHLWDMIKIGADILIIIVLLLCFIQLVDVSKNLQGAAASNAQASQAYLQSLNGTNGAQAKTITAGSIAGVPFGANSK